MSLNIIFGWHLDGLAYPESPTGNIYELGGLVVGPAGLAQQLSMRLGIETPFIPQAVRIAKYMQALRNVDDGNQFFSKSFALDPWSTASCLLVMRDQLVNSGWTGQRLESGNAKLRSFGAVEAHAYPLGSPAEAARRLLKTLREKPNHRLPIRSLKVVTPVEMVPPSWQAILELLKDRGIDVQELTPLASGAGDSDLEKVQRFFLNGRTSALTGDGSLVLLEADDEYQLAEVTAAWLAIKANHLNELVLLRDAPTPVLDAYCSRLALPRAGGNEKSPWRSALQVLPLTLQCSWLPANPYRILELISLPDGPVPRNLTHHFVQALRVQPGFGGDRWKSAWQAVEADVREAASTRGEDANTANKSVTVILEDLHSWLEPTRYDPGAGMPIETALAACRRVYRWASGKFSRPGASEIFLPVLNAARELEDTLIASGLSTINKIQLDRILDAVSGEGSRPERWHAQAADWFLVDHPGQLWSSVSALCWWGFTLKPFPQVHFDPWTLMDQKILEDAGVRLEPPSASMNREAYSWRQAVLNVRNEVLLCRARVTRGQPCSRHPLWDELAELTPSPIEQQSHNILFRPRSKLGLQDLPSTPVSVSSLPGPHRYWAVPEDRINFRMEESATSLRELLGCPMAWVLRYQAQMHPGILLTLPDGDELIGDIAHELFRQLFHAGQPIDQITQRAGQIFDDLVETVGLPLMLRGRSSERDRAKRLLVAAAEHFSRTITAANLTVLDREVHRERTFGHGTFAGDIDVLLGDKDGNPIVIDYKWTKSIKYRLEEIENAQHLQLAAYAWLESAQGKSVTHVGYYMLRQRRLIHTGISDLQVGQHVDSEPIETVWQRAEAAYSSAMSDLLSGTICATGITPTDPEELSGQTLFVLEPPCRFCQYGNICGLSTEHD